MQIRDVNLGRPYYSAEDPYEGLKDAVSTRRSFLALDNLLQIVTEQHARIIALEEAQQKVTTPRKAIAKDDSES